MNKNPRKPQTGCIWTCKARQERRKATSAKDRKRTRASTAKIPPGGAPPQN